MSGLAVRHIRDPPHPLPFHIAFPLVSQTSTLLHWLSSHLPYPSFSSHVISFLASFAAFCPTQSQLHRKERAVGVGSRWFFLPYLLKPGKEPLSWDTLGMMQGLGASHAPPPPQWIWGWVRGTASDSQLQWGWQQRLCCIAHTLLMLWEIISACHALAPYPDTAPEPCTLGGNSGA